MRQTIVAAFVSLLLPVGLWVGPASADPDFSSVGDILRGSRHLLRADDLVYAAPGKDALRTGGLDTTALSMRLSSGARCGSYPDPFLVRLGRVFALKNDVIVRIEPFVTGSSCPGEDLGLYIEDPKNGANNRVIQLPGLRTHQVQMVLADFNGDGFADIAVFDNVAGLSVYTAVNPEDPAQGIKLLEAASLLGLTSLDLTLWSDPVVGDFNGDGALEVAWVSINSTVFLASVCPAKDAKVLGQTCSRAFQVIRSPHTISTGGIRRAFLTSGDYDGVPNAAGLPTQELVILRQFCGGGDPSCEQGGDSRVLTHDMSVSKFDQDLKPTQAPGGLVFVSGNYPHATLPQQPVLTSGRLRWTGKTDQVVFGHGWPTDAIEVITLDHDLQMTAHRTKFDQNDVPGLGNDDPHICFDHLGLAAGRYDPPDTVTGTDVNLQIALFVRHINEVGGTCDHPREGVVTAGHVVIFTVDFTNYAVHYASSSQFIVPAAQVTGNFLVTAPVSNLLWAGDTQGRSYLLGPPTKVTVDHYAQPSVILAAPPMHVDFVTPVGQSTPIVLNLSAVPAAYFTKYQVEETTSDKTSDQSTTSWSRGVGEKIKEKLTFGGADVGPFFKQTFDFSAKQTWEGSTETTNQSYSKHGLDFTQQTGFDDLVWYTDSRFNMYVYRVIGHLECPDHGHQPTCTEEEKRPLVLQVSGPDSIHREAVSGATLEWYQPPWEPGNVLSYPSSEAQLKAIYPDLHALSDPSTWLTDSTVRVEKTSWTSAAGQSKSTSSKATFSEDVSLSVSGGLAAKGWFSIEAGFTLSGSFVNSTAGLNTHETSIGKSTGIGIEKPGSFADPTHYAYPVTSYIFGQAPPPARVDDQPAPPTDITTSGMLRTAFLVDPTALNAGSWWAQAYTQAPDVALNHPQRWDLKTRQVGNNQDPSCLSIGESSTAVQCATLQEALPDDPWQSAFHYLRGFFITGEASGGKGPQLQTATAGDRLVLQVRVYNYSQAPVPGTAQVRVRFYGQPWDHQHSKPKGDSFLIGEDTLGPIPPFRNDDGLAPLNWVLAQTTFDTAKEYPGWTGKGNQYLAFWVVVWMQTPQGLVAEMPGHGLTKDFLVSEGGRLTPRDLPSLVEAHKVSEPYSNNVGFYKFAFYVHALGSPLQSAPPKPPGLPGPPVRLGPVELSSERLIRGETVEVSTTVIAHGDAVPGATVRFYDGDPGKGGKLFDVERVAHIGANDSHHVSVRFRPDTCGFHSIFVVMEKGTPSELVGESPPLFLNCRRRR